MPFTFEPQRYPTTPGCYLMRDAAGRVIYVGKAKNLRRRLASYFRPTRRHRSRYDDRRQRLVAAVAAIEVILVNNELESLVLENNLIKRHRPRFNRMLMPENSGYHYLVLTDEPLPRLVHYRKRRLNKALAGKEVEQRFGPYLSRESCEGLLAYVADHFGLRTCYPMPARVCLRYHLRACCGVCERRVTPHDYAAIVERVTTFLARPNADLVEDMRAEMLASAARLEFERAQRIKEQMQVLAATLLPQIVERDVEYDQEVIYFGPPEARQALVAVIQKGMLLDMALHDLDARIDYPQACLGLMLARVKPEEVICNAPSETLDALRAIEGYRVRVLDPSSGVPFDLLELCRRNYEYRQSDLVRP